MNIMHVVHIKSNYNRYFTYYLVYLRYFYLLADSRVAVVQVVRFVSKIHNSLHKSGYILFRLYDGYLSVNMFNIVVMA